MSDSASAKTVYVARVCRFSARFVICKPFICREGVFSSWEKAREFLAREAMESDDETSRLCERHIIMEYVVDVDEPEERRQYWVFDTSGKLVDEELSGEGTLGDYNLEYSGKYAVGDIVRVKPNIDCRESYLIDSYYGVVVCVPKKKEEWLAEQRPIDEWSPLYVIYYISPPGFFDHEHLPEIALEPVSDSDENVHPFLRLYSKYVKGQAHLPEQLLEDLSNKVFFRDDVKHYKLYLDT